ncbi:hypothetical protein A9Q99_02505 [Gammaproteobacteria bacterium 45_16_T64]|nr:hypothetical protein A9Q99_02505 [Gammaproteobacteria bacterium 45_16_T64]
MNPQVSIVIPTYNRAVDLKRAIDSVFNQTFSEWEILVVDNNSTDSTDELISGYASQRITLLKIENHGVIAASRNLGIKHARGKWVAFLDSDDWWCPDKLTQSVQYLEGGADLVFHDLFLVRSLGQRNYRRSGVSRGLELPVFNDLLMSGNAIENSSVVVRRSLLNEIGGLFEDKELIAMEDYDAWLRIAKLTDNFVRLDQVLGYYWLGGGNVSNPTLKLRNLTLFEERYSEEIVSLCGGGMPWWFDYGKGRAQFLLGKLPDAKLSLSKVSLLASPLTIKLKTVYMLVRIRFSKLSR